MNNYFSSEFFTNNRRKLCSKLDPDFLVIITSNGLLQRNSDVNYPFRQDSNFWYLTGIEDPDLILVINANEDYLITAERDEIRTTFDGKVDTDKNSKVSGVKLVYDEKKGWQKLTEQLKQTAKIYIIEPPEVFEPRHGLFTNPARRILTNKIKKLSPKTKTSDIRKQLAQLRMIKQSEELQAIQYAIDITSQAFTNVKNDLKEFNNEWQIHNSLNQEFSAQRSQHAYQPIVAGGNNACTLHYVENKANLKDNLVLIDAGAEWQNYASDITRTYSRGKPTIREQNVFDSVVEVQHYAMGLLAPGITLKEYEQKVENFMGQKLKELRLIKIIDRVSVRKYYPHATSHFLGLDTHDIADYAQPLEAGMVMTVEPGIYIPEEGIGIRIEDDVVITKNGQRNMSQKLPADLK